jgi:hypothetical protein
MRMVRLVTSSPARIASRNFCSRISLVGIVSSLNPKV